MNILEVIDDKKDEFTFNGYGKIKKGIRGNLECKLRVTITRISFIFYIPETEEIRFIVNYNEKGEFTNIDIRDTTISGRDLGTIKSINKYMTMRKDEILDDITTYKTTRKEVIKASILRAMNSKYGEENAKEVSEYIRSL